jgi:S-DNA-T family DNA segregation ATPase FtsK/SpoIIIE
MEPVALDLAHGHALVVGPRRSGRTTALETAVLGLLGQSEAPEVVVLAPRRSAVADCSGIASSAQGLVECEEAAARLAAELDARSEADRPLVVVIDDAEELAESVAATPLLTLVRRGRDGGVRVLAGAERNAAHRAFGNWLRELRNDGQGLLLRPELDVDGELLGTRLPRGFRRTFPPGRGYLVEGGVAELAQVAASAKSPTVSA